MTIAYTAARGQFAASKPRIWKDPGSTFGGYDVTADGKRLVIRDRPEIERPENLPTRAVFLLNFFDELKRRVP